MPFSYENYDDVCSTYSGMRRPVGDNQQLEFFRSNPEKRNLADQGLLDAGCGTGNYACVYAPHFASVHCVDYSAGMLRAAQANLRAVAGESGPDGAALLDRVTFSTADVSNLRSLADASFDALCCNQVVHHLRADDGHADLRRAAREFFRVLAPGGRACVNFTAPESQLFATWWSALIPDAVSTWARRAPTRDALETALRDAGFEGVRADKIVDSMYDDALYNDLDRFADDVESYARAESTFRMCTPEELRGAAQQVREMRQQGTLQEWFKKREEVRLDVGQSFNVYAVKPSP